MDSKWDLLSFQGKQKALDEEVLKCELMGGCLNGIEQATEQHPWYHIKVMWQDINEMKLLMDHYGNHHVGYFPQIIWIRDGQT